MGNVIDFPHRTNQVVQNGTPDLFRDLSEQLGIDLHKILVEQDPQEVKWMQRKLQKDSLLIRSALTK